MENHGLKKNMFFDAKGFQNKAKMLPGIYEKTLQKTMPKTHRPIIKHIIKKRGARTSTKPCLAEGKTTFLQIQQNSNIIKTT